MTTPILQLCGVTRRYVSRLPSSWRRQAMNAPRLQSADAGIIFQRGDDHRLTETGGRQESEYHAGRQAQCETDRDDGRTATHGSGVKNGNLSTGVSAIEFVNAAGDLVTLSKKKDGEQFSTIQRRYSPTRQSSGCGHGAAAPLIFSVGRTRGLYERVANGRTFRLFCHSAFACRGWENHLQNHPASPTPSRCLV